MTKLNPYLTFNGNCREAITFYKECMGGELSIQTVGESPMAEQMPEAKDHVMHAALTSGDIVLYASDMMGTENVIQGNTVTLCLNCESEEEITSLFEKLSQGGKVTHPLKKEFWGDTYGDFADKFGIRWMMNYHQPK